MQPVQMPLDLLGNYVSSHIESEERPFIFYKTFIIEILHNLKPELSYDPAILLFGICPQEVE